MSSEARVTASLQIRIGNTDYQSRPSAFQADVSTEGGPTPGMVTAALAGTVVSLAALTVPGGLARLQNLDDTNYVEVGSYEPHTGKFQPLLELLPGETYPVRLSRFLGQELGTASGTAADATVVQLMVKAVGAPCKVLVEAFNK